MIRFIILISILFSFAACDKTVLPTSTSYEKTYGDSLLDYATSAVLVGNHIFMLGTSTSFSSGGDKDFFLLKIDEEGNQLFEKTYGGASDDFGLNIISTSDGNLLLLGTSNSFGNSYDIFLVKINLDGDTLWQKNYGGPSFDLAEGIVETDDGGILILGPQSNGTTSDFRLIRLDAQGNELWQKTYISPYEDNGIDIAAAGNDEYVLFGRRTDGDDDFYAIKINGQGDSLWTATYGGSDYEEGHSIFQTQDHGFVLCGHSASLDPLHHLYGVKIDQNGVVVWEKHFGGGAHDGGEDAIELANGHLLFVGQTDSYGNASKRAYLVETEANGQLIEETSFGGNLSDKFSCILESSTAIYAIGESESFSSDTQMDVFIVKQRK